MQFQFNSDSSVMGTDDVAERIEAQVREKLTRFEERLTRLEVHVHNEHHHTHGNDDKGCTIEVRVCIGVVWAGMDPRPIIGG